MQGKSLFFIHSIALKLYGKDWKKVEDYIGTRTGAQIRSHAQKYFLRIEKEINGTFDPNAVSHKSDNYSDDSFAAEDQDSQESESGIQKRNHSEEDKEVKENIEQSADKSSQRTVSTSGAVLN